MRELLSISLLTEILENAIIKNPNFKN